MRQSNFQPDLKMSWTPLNLTVRVGCNLAGEITVPTPVLFVLNSGLEDCVLVMQEKLRFGIGLPCLSIRTATATSPVAPCSDRERNEIRHDAMVAVSSAAVVPLATNKQIYVTKHQRIIRTQT